MGLTIMSEAFSDGGVIPARHTCDGVDISPPLAWSGAPVSTRSFALIVDDPDAPDPAAPQRTWVHWVVFNLPATSHGLEEAASGGLPPGSGSGRNDWERTGWGGPCPPIGRHRYFFKLYALDSRIERLEEPTKTALERALEGHILDQATLVGTYERPG